MPVVVPIHKVPRPNPVVIKPLDSGLHIAHPENIRLILDNMLEMKVGVQIRDKVIDAYENQLK